MMLAMLLLSTSVFADEEDRELCKGMYIGDQAYCHRQCDVKSDKGTSSNKSCRKTCDREFNKIVNQCIKEL
jgi:hypothetical protein